jgi:hypothetical protein
MVFVLIYYQLNMEEVHIYTIPLSIDTKVSLDIQNINSI